MKGLNLSGWSKVSEDKKSTTLKHDKGHMMTLAHSKLPKIQQEALKRLKMSDGGTVDPNKAKSAQDSMRNAFHFAEGTETPIEAKPQAPVTVNVSTAPEMQQTKPMPSPVQQAQPVPVQVPAVAKNPNVLLKNGSMNAPGAAQTAQQGVKLAADVQAAQSAASVPQLQQSLDAQSQLNKNEVDNINNLKSHADEFSNWQKANPLNEKAYLENMGAGKKITTALGLLLSGAGSGLNGGSNMAMDFLNKQIDRNIQAQKDRFGQVQTIWGAYKDLYGNEQVANNMARLHQLDMLNTQAKMTAAQLGTPAAQAALMQLESKISPEMNKLILDSAGNLSSLPNNPKQGEEALPDQGANNPNKKLIDNKIVAGNYKPENPSFGMVTSQASVQPNYIEKDNYADTGILSHTAKQKLDSLRYTPKAKEEINQIKEQYTQAKAADALLSQLHGLHQDLYKDAVAGGSSGYIRRHDPTASVPLIGDAISRTFVQPATATNTNKSYDSLKSRITGDIATALKGTNISGEEINHMVNSNLPEPGDTPELIEKKERNIRLFIKNSVNKSLLEDWDLLNK